MSATHWRTVHKRKNEHLLFGEDLGPVGTTIDVEVIDSGVLTVSGADNKSKPMPWLAFAGKDGRPKQKKLGLNVTNSKAMQSLCGTPIVEKWRGWITLVVVETTYTDSQTGTRQKTDAIRIAPQRPQGKRTERPHDVPPSTPAAGQPADKSTPDVDEQREIAAQEAANAGR